MMHWNCPHCGIKLITSQEHLGTGWSFSRCAQCTGYSLIRKTEINVIRVDKAPPGEKIIPSQTQTNPRNQHPDLYPHQHQHQHQSQIHTPPPAPMHTQLRTPPLAATGVPALSTSFVKEEHKAQTTSVSNPNLPSSLPAPTPSPVQLGPATPATDSYRSVSEIAHEIQEKTKRSITPPPPPIISSQLMSFEQHASLSTSETPVDESNNHERQNSSPHPSSQNQDPSRLSASLLNPPLITNALPQGAPEQPFTDSILHTQIKPLSEATFSISGTSFPESNIGLEKPQKSRSQSSPLLISAAMIVIMAGGYIVLTQKKHEWNQFDEKAIISDQIKETALAPIPNASETSKKRIETQTELVHTYSGPGLHFPVIYELAPHSNYEALEVHDSWVKVNLEHLSEQLNIKSGWVPTQKIKFKPN